MKLFIWSLLWPEPLESFLSVAHCFENNDDKQTTVNDLVELMQEHLTSIDTNKKNIWRTVYETNTARSLQR